jgi:hypothetical protein
MSVMPPTATKQLQRRDWTRWAITGSRRKKPCRRLFDAERLSRAVDEVLLSVDDKDSDTDRELPRRWLLDPHGLRASARKPNCTQPRLIVKGVSVS